MIMQVYFAFFDKFILINLSNLFCLLFVFFGNIFLIFILIILIFILIFYFNFNIFNLLHLAMNFSYHKSNVFFVANIKR